MQLLCSCSPCVPTRIASPASTAIGLNVGEAEFYALMHGGAHGLGMQSFMRDMMVELDVVKATTTLIDHGNLTYQCNLDATIVCTFDA